MGVNRSFGALFALGALVALAVHSGDGDEPRAAGADRASILDASGAPEAADALDPGLLRWLLPPRWWRAVPERPAPPAVVAASDTSLTVTWTAPESAVFDIADYDLQYRAGTASKFADWGHDGVATRATITGLAAATAYRCACAR